MNIHKRTWEIVEADKSGDKASRTFDIIILALILLNVIAVIIGSIESVREYWDTYLNVFEAFSVAVFTVEYLARLWSCTTDPQFAGLIRGRVRHALRGMSIIDLLAILPFYLPYLGFDLRSLRVLRLYIVRSSGIFQV